MKKFIKRTIIFTLFGLVLFQGIVLFTEIYPTFSGYLLDQKWLRTKGRIKTSKGKIKRDTLYVGCSVAGQFLPFNRDNILTSNGSTYAIGNYFLIKNALSKNKNIKNVIYFIVPDVIGHNLARIRTHHMFVKPFYTRENLKDFEESPGLMDLLNKNKDLNLNLYNSYKILALDDFDYSDSSGKRSDSLSMKSIEWLVKIKHLCENLNIKFAIISPPVPASRKMITSDWQIIRKQVKDTELEKLFEVYLNSITYWDDRFLMDDLHWKSNIIKERRKEVITNINEQLN